MPSRESSLVVYRDEAIAVEDAAALSRTALTRSLASRAELGVFALSGEAMILGLFQRFTEVGEAHEPPSRTVLRRGSGGPLLLASEGLVWVQLALASPGALVACSAGQLLNRYVRPLLRALTRLGATTNYFGRDWLATRHRPTAWVGFAHAKGTGRSLVEALVPVTAPWWSGPRPSFAGKEPWTLEEALGKRVHVAHVCDAIATAYREAYDVGAVEGDTPVVERSVEAMAPTPWTATREEAIGAIHAGVDDRGRMRLGGELMVAADAMEAFEAALEELHAKNPPSNEELGALVDAHFGAPEAALFGVRSLANVRDVLAEAYGSFPERTLP